MSQSDPVTRLRRIVQKAGSQRKAAAVLGCTQQHICDMLNGRRNVSKATLRKLGYTSIRVQL